MGKVSARKVVTAVEASESPLPPRIQKALGELGGAAREGLLALSVGVGLGVVHGLMELEVAEVVGRRASMTRTGGGPSRPRGRVDDVGRPACAGQAPEGPHGRQRARAARRGL